MKKLPVALGVVALPGLSASSSGLVETVTLAETAGLLASGSKTTGLAVLVDWLDDPVDTGITTDGLVLWVDKDDLEVLVGGVLVDPVGVKDSQVGATASDTLLSGGLEGSLVLELVDSLVGWLSYNSIYQRLSIILVFSSILRTVGSTLWNWALASTTTNANTVDDIALLGLVTETASLIWARWAGSAVNDVQLAELYYALSAMFNECIAKTYCPQYF